MAVIPITEPGPPAKGFALFDLGFRPFFLAAALLAVMIQPLWLAAVMGYLTLPDYFGATGWHAHEMIFGYSSAVIAGFLLTAGGNWTGQVLAKGGMLTALVLLWLAPRILIFVPAVPSELVAVLDLLFLPILALLLLRPIIKIKQWRNIAFPVLLILMAGGNLLIHAQALGWSESTAEAGLLLALYVIVLVIVLMAGRVVPFFIERGAQGARVRKWKWVEVISIASIVVLLPAELVWPDSISYQAVVAVAAVSHGIRWWGWLSRPAWRVPLLWVLIGGYFWVVAGLVLLLAATLSEIPKSLALHAFTVGGIGVLTLGMMARVSLGHTGRMLQPHPAMAWSFALINLAVVFRVLLPTVEIFPYEADVALATAVWEAAFLIFLVIYTPILIQPRVDGRPR